MNLEEVLKLADEIVFIKTGQHLDDLQEAVLRGTVQRKTYKEIAKDFDCSESNIRQIGSDLWQILSEQLGEDVSKSNLSSAMQRLQVSIYLNTAQEESVQINSINVCGEGRHLSDIPNSYIAFSNET